MIIYWIRIIMRIWRIKQFRLTGSFMRRCCFWKNYGTICNIQGMTPSHPVNNNYPFINVSQRAHASCEKFEILRRNLETVYGQSRILVKPNDYILDQDHHSHLANQAISFVWQFYAEMLCLEKLRNNF